MPAVLAASHSRAGPFLLGLVAMLVPAAMQLVLFAFFARVLGAAEYGLYIALMAWVPICFELVGWGSGEYLLKRTAQHPDGFRTARAHLRAAFWLSLPLAAIAFVALTFASLGATISIWTIAVVGVAEFAGMRMLVNAEQMCLASRQMGPANWFRSLQVAPRIAGVAVAFFVLGQTSFEALALGGSLGMLGGGLAGAVATHRLFGGAASPSLVPEGMRLGTWFMGTQLVRAGQHNIDRIVLAPLLDPTTLGLYGAAQRIIQLSLLPLQSVLRLAYPGFFKAGSEGLEGSFRHGLTVLPLALATSVGTSLALVAAAPWLPLILGQEFEGSVRYLLHLAPILPLFAVSSVLSDTLSGAGLLRQRLLLTTMGVAAQAMMFVVLHDGMALVLASYAGLTLSCSLSGLAIGLLMRGQRAKASPVPDAP